MIRFLRTGVTLIGILMMGLALGADSIGLSAGAGAGPGQIALFVLGGTLVLVTLWARVPRTSDLPSCGPHVARAYQRVAAVVFGGVLIVLAAELALITVSKALGSPEPREAISRETVSYYQSQDWASRYWTEHQASLPERYHPYVLWRRAPFEGQTINVRPTGIRNTPGSDCSNAAYRVFMFGGSTMWGTGSPDWATIPAHFQAGLPQLVGEPACVVNLGETGFVSTQSVLQLLLQLKAGQIPDAVIFYDGHNDVFAAYQSGLAGVHENLREIAAKMAGGSSRIRFQPPLRWFDSWSLFALATRLAGRPPARHAAASDRLPGPESAAHDVAALSSAVVNDYLANYAIVAALAEQYGFDYLFFWQPAISVGHKPLTPEEEQMKQALEAQRGATNLYATVYQAIEMAAGQYEHLVYLGDLFDTTASQLWIDEWHVTPEGNRLIGEHMLKVWASRRGPAVSRGSARD